MQTLKNDHSISIIYITHDLATAYHVSDYVLVLHEGRIVEAGPPEDVIQSPDPSLHAGAGRRDPLARSAAEMAGSAGEHARAMGGAAGGARPRPGLRAQGRLG